MRFLLASVFLTSSLWSANVGNPASPDLIIDGIFTNYNTVSARAGYEGNFVINHRMRQTEKGKGRVDCFSFFGNNALATCNIVERLDLYLGLGAAVIDASWRFTLDEVTSRVEVTSKNHFSWFVGTNVLLIEWGKATLGAGGKFLSTAPSLDELKIDGEEIGTEGDFSYHEWQLNLGLSYDSGILTPYIGIKYDQTSSSLDTNSPFPITQFALSDNQFENRNHVGLYLGCSVSSGDIFFLNVEGRVIDEEAISLAADFRF